MSDKTAEQLRASSLEVVVAFLLGEGELDGVWFGEKHERLKGAFWWREYLREAFEFGPIAWESTTPAYFKYITQAKYEKFSPAVRHWYKPYRCTDCDNTRADSGEAVAGWLVTLKGCDPQFVTDIQFFKNMDAAGVSYTKEPLFTHPRSTSVDVRDAERYRWLRGHFRFANDSVFELWFDASVQATEEEGKFLDSAIDQCKAAIASREGR